MRAVLSALVASGQLVEAEALLVEQEATSPGVFSLYDRLMIYSGQLPLEAYRQPERVGPRSTFPVTAMLVGAVDGRDPQAVQDALDEIGQRLELNGANFLGLLESAGRGFLTALQGDLGAHNEEASVVSCPSAVLGRSTGCSRNGRRT